MDIGCSLRHSRLLHGDGGMSCKQRSMHHFDSSITFRRRGSGCAFLGNSSTILKARVNGITACWNARLASTGEFKVSNVKRTWSSRNNTIFMGSRSIWLKCQGNDSLAYVNGNGRNVEYLEGSEELGLGPTSSAELTASIEEEEGGQGGVEAEAKSVDELKEILQKALKDLEIARVNSNMFEEKCKKISETSISLHDEAANAFNDVNSALEVIQEIVNEESLAKEAVQKATMALSLAEARLQVAVESLEVAKEEHDSPEGSSESDGNDDIMDEEKDLLVAQEDVKECQTNLANCEAALRLLQNRKEELQKEVEKLNEIAEKAQLNASKADEDVTNIMLLAEQAVAFELEATQRVSDAEIALQRAEKSISSPNVDTIETIQVQDAEAVSEEEKNVQAFSSDFAVKGDGDLLIDDESLIQKRSPETLSDKTSQILADLTESDHENGQLTIDTSIEVESEVEKSKNAVQSQTKKHETQKDFSRDSSLFAPKALLKKSSRFFSASFFSFTEDGTEFTPASVFQGLVESVQKQLPKVILGFLLVGARYVDLTKSHFFCFYKDDSLYSSNFGNVSQCCLLCQSS